VIIHDHEEEETKLIISSLLTDMIMKILLMRQQHLAKLNRESVRRCRERNTIGHMRKVREKNEKVDKRVDKIILLMKTCWKVVNRLI